MKARPAGPGGASFRKTTLIGIRSARRGFDADLDQHSAVEVRLHHVQGHVPPSQAGLEERVLRSQVRKAPSQRRQHAEIPARG